MRSIIGCDAHKQFSVFVAIDNTGKTSSPVRVGHDREEYIRFLRTLPPGSEIAVEATGHWYWMVDEMESAGHRPHLANPTEAKKRMGKTNKTDALDAKGLAILLHNGTLPESWIPPGDLRDQRELLRTRMALRDLRSSLKHRIHAAIDRYGLHAIGISDLFGVRGRVYIDRVVDQLPSHPRPG
ncbi:IS110 family transposase [Pseudacidobacterium ailaaui]|jgi:transposase|uniref:IS110 family transposase n=1 Tax=Pseudacidobacterium ailaaui TaxID=1382359 RepID=UPI00047EBF00|nr:IS110 family transposase [Pseudacidobacterium ailaaui]